MIGGEGKTAEVDGGYFGGYVKPSNLKENRRDRRLAINQNGKRQCVVIIRERNGNSAFRPSSRLKATPRTSSRPASPTARSSKPTKPDRGIACTRISRLPGSTTKKPTASTALAPTWRKATSPGFAAQRLAIITTLRALTCFATLRKALGARITAAFRMAIKCSALRTLPLPASLRWISVGIGSGTSKSSRRGIAPCKVASRKSRNLEGGMDHVDEEDFINELAADVEAVRIVLTALLVGPAKQNSCIYNDTKFAAMSGAAQFGAGEPQAPNAERFRQLILKRLEGFFQTWRRQRRYCEPSKALHP